MGADAHVLLTGIPVNMSTGRLSPQADSRFRRMRQLGRTLITSESQLIVGGDWLYYALSLSPWSCLSVSRIYGIKTV